MMNTLLVVSKISESSEYLSCLFVVLYEIRATFNLLDVRSIVPNAVGLLQQERYEKKRLGRQSRQFATVEFSAW